MTKGVEFVEQGLNLYEQKFKEQQLKRLYKQAKSLIYSFRLLLRDYVSSSIFI